VRFGTRHAWLIVALLVLAVAVPAAAEKFSPGALRLAPNTTSSATTLVINGSFEQEPGARLKAYNVDIARGFKFDPHAVPERCTVAQAQSFTCPDGSLIGAGTADVTIADQAATFDVQFFLLPPQRHGDIAGLVLSVHQSGSTAGFALIGRMVRLKRGPFGLELRFADAAKQLPTDLTVQLNRVRAKVGKQRSGRTLLTTPKTCTKKGWPFRLVVSYSTGTEDYTGAAPCKNEG
jgi:hypothetical protein